MSRNFNNDNEWMIRIGDVLLVILIGIILTIGIRYYKERHKEPTGITNGVPV